MPVLIFLNMKTGYFNALYKNLKPTLKANKFYVIFTGYFLLLFGF